MARKNIILVEGRDDLHVVAHLLKFYGHEGKIYIETREGIDELLQSLAHDLHRGSMGYPRKAGQSSLEASLKALENS